jgi:hypothetical protein
MHNGITFIKIFAELATGSEYKSIRVTLNGNTFFVCTDNMQELEVTRTFLLILPALGEAYRNI